MRTSTETKLFSSNGQGVALDEATQSALSSYFQLLNDEQFGETALLFSPEGVLIPPFSRPIQGREAIAAYLKKEAVGITLAPHSWEQAEPSAIQAADSEQTVELGQAAKPTQSDTAQLDTLQSERSQSAYRVKGKVKTSLFTVNVAWMFQLNAEAQIDRVEVKLLASMKELMAMQAQS